MPPQEKPIPRVLRKQTNWKDLYFYQKSEVLYQMTFVFCKRFLPAQGDRTVDQMVQAARSGKQNIVEGSADGVTSTEMQLKLLNVARSSIQELQEDYLDYIKARFAGLWEAGHPRYEALLDFCRTRNTLTDYQPFFERWNDEEMANTGYTLCRMVDKMMSTYIEGLETQFVQEGGIKERMYAARTGYRQEQNARLQAENQQLKAENARLQAENQQLKELLKKLSPLYQLDPLD